MEQAGLEIQKRKKGDVTVLDLSGNLTIGAGEQALKDVVQELVDKKSYKVVMNMKAVEFMDSSGVGVLVKSFTTLANKGGRVKLLQPGKLVRHTLNVTGLMGVFEVFDDEAGAIASF